MTRTLAAVAPLLVLAAIGCGGPNRANVALRKTIQSLDAEVEQLKRQRGADAATIRALQAGRGGVASSLDPSQLDQLFTVAGLSLGRLTGGADLDPAAAGDEGLKVYVKPTDAAGDALKAAGGFVVEAFDLAAEAPLVGRWEFAAADARELWVSGGLLNEYVLACPWDAPPAHAEVTLKVTFTDALTGRQVAEQKVVTVELTPPL